MERLKRCIVALMRGVLAIIGACFLIPAIFFGGPVLLFLTIDKPLPQAERAAVVTIATPLAGSGNSLNANRRFLADWAKNAGAKWNENENAVMMRLSTYQCTHPTTGENWILEASVKIQPEENQVKVSYSNVLLHHPLREFDTPGMLFLAHKVAPQTREQMSSIETSCLVPLSRQLLKLETNGRI